ncbi:LamG domain-containing protein [Micromonospora sp. C81]|uniref:LamG domain-containing protein n=1 Tax=Micromonospora sp. C81 TaxID=2824881 RepID=UPI001B371178|nr:LamG domain-containing protein [Micromonospora sp. C81]MBQ1040649.1 LamG domain-containing protein [Micromonospora sp. C81]
MAMEDLRREPWKGDRVGTGQENAGLRRSRTRLGVLALAVALVTTAMWLDVDSHDTQLQALGPSGESSPAAPWTESQARIEAQKAGKPIEVRSAAAEREVTYANPDGSFTHDSHAQPFRTRQGGKWVPIDVTLVRQNDGSVGPKAAVTAMRFSGGGRGVPLATISRAGRVMNLSWPGDLPRPTLSGASAIYHDVLPDVDLVVHVSATSFSHVLVVKTPGAAALPRVKTLSYGLSGTNLRFSASQDGRLTAADIGSGQPVFEAPTPTMWDAGDPGEAAADSGDFDASRSAPETARRAELGVQVIGSVLRLNPDPALLADPQARFPLYIDPYTSPTSNTSWTMVDSGYPNEEYWKFSGDQRLGLCPTDGSICNSSKVKRLFFTLPTPYQDDRIIVSSATFKITMIHAYDSTARNVSLYRTGAISSATNWSNQPGGSSWTGATKQDTRSPTVTQGSCTSTNQNVTFTATQAAQAAASGNWPTATFGLKADSESDYHYVKRFCGNAVLSVTYNRAPAAPTNLSTNPGGACKTGTPSISWYVSSVPKLSAYLADPDSGDAEPLNAKFTVTWTPIGGTLQTKSWTSLAKANKSTFDYNLADATTGVPNLPEQVVVSWYVEAYDGSSWSGKSPTCGFKLDKSKPAGPDIDSVEFLPSEATDTGPGCVESGEWLDGLGRYGGFTFDSAATDVVSYKYGFDIDPLPTNTLNPTTLGGPVSLTWMPLTEAPHFVTVIAVDAAGKESDTSICHFNIASGPAAGQWNLADAAGTTEAADERGINPATAGRGVTFAQPGPGGGAHPAVQLDGNAEGWLATSTTGLLDTSKEFAVSAWVKADDLTRPQAAVSQDGTGQPGFYLGYEPNGSHWRFGIPTTDVQGLGVWEVTSTQQVTPSTGWTHLVGLFDPVKDTVSLYVNGNLSATAAATGQWASHGNVQLGRRTERAGFTWAWRGGLADVAVYDRMLGGAEIKALAAPRLQRQVYWSLDGGDVPDDNPNVTVSPETVNDSAEPDSNRSLTLYNGASLMVPDPEDIFAEPALVGAGHMVLDGVSAYAASPTALVGQTRSFSVAVRAKLAASCAGDQVVLSQPGAKVSRFLLRCVTVNGQMRWQLNLLDNDAVNGSGTVLVDDVHLPDPDDTDGQHLVVTYNAFTDDVFLYVDGELALSAQGTNVGTWNGPDNGVQVGRALLDGSQQSPVYGGYFSGLIDEVRVYSGVLDPTTVIRLASTTAQSDL